ncbi:MAG: hypothetical protein JWN62_1417 [Acidimicrobiales bacterium]|nr:hypothetical protein [Acidimicrobiales bacterium]
MVVVASVLLGAAFLFAGGAKIAAGPAWPAQGSALGAPSAVVPFVPWLEIVVGAALCAQLIRPLPAIVAALMLVVFTALVGLRLAQGEHPPCACFGSWSAKPLSWRHLARNAVLLSIAIVAIVA